MLRIICRGNEHNNESAIHLLKVRDCRILARRMRVFQLWEMNSIRAHPVAHSVDDLLERGSGISHVVALLVVDCLEAGAHGAPLQSLSGVARDLQPT